MFLIPFIIGRIKNIKNQTLINITINSRKTFPYQSPAPSPLEKEGDEVALNIYQDQK